MRKLFTTCKSLILGGLMLSGVVSSAQVITGTTGAYRFPQTIGYGVNGRTPSTSIATQKQNAFESYNYWKEKFVTNGCGGIEKRVIFDHFPGTTRGTEDKLTTVSEGIAYGMLLSAYAGDKALFDGLWAYYQRFSNNNGVMNFKIYNCGVAAGGGNGATDAELDAAMGLIVASYQWPGQNNYGGDASNLIRIIREKEFIFSTGVQKPGDQFGGTSGDNITNPSYFSPAYYEVYKAFDPGQDVFWDRAISKGYDIIEAAQTLSTNGNNNIGLVPDWTSITGGYSARAAQLNYEDDGKNFIFDAIRTPFRTGIDALWNGRGRAKTYCNNLIDWAYDKYGGTTVGMGSKFNMNGDQLNNFHSNTFVGSFAVAAMGTDPTGFGAEHTEAQYQSYLNNAYNDNESTEPGFGQYFNASFKVMTQFVMLGNFYKPPGGTCASPDLNGGAEILSLCNGPVTLNAGLAADSYSWRKDGVDFGGTASTQQVTTPGIYNVVTTIGNCTRTDKVEVFPDVLTADFSFSVGPGAIALENTSQGGISNTTWNDGTSDFSTDFNTNFNYTGSGTVDIQLTVTNSGFAGCNDTETITKSILYGGDGWSADEFNTTTNVIAYADPDQGAYEATPTTNCSATSTDQCPNNPCGLFVATASATPVQYSPFGFIVTNGALPAGDPIEEPIDISAAPKVRMRVRASADCNIGVGLNAAWDGDPTKFATSTRIKIPLVANTWTILEPSDLDFTSVNTAYINATNIAQPLDYSKVAQVQVFPFEYAPALPANGTIEVDYVIIGAAGLEAPVFDIARNAADNPLYNAAGNTYSSWVTEVTACNPTVQVEAKTCTATEVIWFNGDVQIGTGTTIDVAPGTYTVKLVNEGGTLEDEVEVIEANLNADFSYSRENFQVDFSNTSTGNTSTSWDFGDPDSDFNTSTSNLPGHFFEGGAKAYDVTLTVTNSDCGTTDSKTETIDISCDQQPADILDGLVDVTEGCDGTSATVTFTTPAFASTTKIFYPGNTEIAENLESQTFTITESSNLKIEAYPACATGGVPSNVIIPIALRPAPSSAFTIKEEGQFALVFPSQLLPQNTYSWTATGALTAAPLTNGDMEDYFEYATDGDKTICLTVTNDCDATGTEVCNTATILVTGLNAQDKNGELSVFPTAVDETLTIQLNGTANVKVADLIGNTVSESTIADKGTVNVSNLTPGAYVLLIELDGEVVTKRFIKE